MNNRTYLFAGVIAVVFAFAGYNLYSYFQEQAVVAAEQERIAEERRIERDQERAAAAVARQEEAARLEEERLARQERERLEAAEREAERERARLEAEASAQLEREAREAERQEQARIAREERTARARAVTDIEDLGEEVLRAIRGLSPRYITDNPEEFQGAYPGASPEGRLMGVNRRILIQPGTTNFMIFAATASNTSVLQALVDIGVDLNAANDMGFTPLMFAAAYNTPEALAFLLENGADPLAQAYVRDLNALHVASLLNPQPDVIDVLLNAGLALEDTVSTGETALLGPIGRLLRRTTLTRNLARTNSSHGAEYLLSINALQDLHDREKLSGVEPATLSVHKTLVLEPTALEAGCAPEKALMASRKPSLFPQRPKIHHRRLMDMPPKAMFLICSPLAWFYAVTFRWGLQRRDQGFSS